MKAVFFDRDGVINHDLGHVFRPEEFIFIEGIFELARAAILRGYKLFVVTNQGGIGRGIYSEDDFIRLSDWMCRQFLSQSAPISKVFYCPFHPEHGVGKYKRESEDKKPAPGMILKAKAEFGLNLAESLMIGDKHTDMQAAKTAGISKRVLFPNERFDQESDCATHSITALSQVISLL